MPDLSMSGKLPAGPTNGLAALVAELLDNPTRVRAVIALVDVDRVTEDPATGDRVPRMRIRSIEPVTDTADAADVQRMFRRAAERRTGQTELPLELEREIDKIFNSPDDPTGDTADEGATDPE
jgi:hypothetical protein